MITSASAGLFVGERNRWDHVHIWQPGQEVMKKIPQFLLAQGDHRFIIRDLFGLVQGDRMQLLLQGKQGRLLIDQDARAGDFMGNELLWLCSSGHLALTTRDVANNGQPGDGCQDDPAPGFLMFEGQKNDSDQHQESRDEHQRKV